MSLTADEGKGPTWNIFNRNKEVKPTKYDDPQYTKIDYYTFPEPCVFCGQKIVNGVLYPSYVKEAYWNVLEGTYLHASKSEEVPNNSGWFYVTQKVFYRHWKCPEHVVEIPKELIGRIREGR